MAAKSERTIRDPQSAIRNRFNVRISGQVEASSMSDAAKKLAEGLIEWNPDKPAPCDNCKVELTGKERFCPRCGHNLATNATPAPLLEGGIVRITPAEGG